MLPLAGVTHRNFVLRVKSSFTAPVAMPVSMGNKTAKGRAHVSSSHQHKLFKKLSR